MHVLLFGELILSALFSMRIRASKGAFYKLRGQIAQNVLLRRAPSYGFSKYSGKVMTDKTQMPVTRHPDSKRAFRDIHVPKLLDTLRNIKKLSYDCAGHFREHFVQFADFNLFKYPLTLESYAENAAWKERLLTSIRTEPLKS